MANKPTKPINHAKVITPEQIRQQKENQALAMLVQKRETFAINILCSLCQGVSSARSIVKADLHSTTIAIDTNGIVADAVKMADELLEKLYPVTKEEKK